MWSTSKHSKGQEIACLTAEKEGLQAENCRLTKKVDKLISCIEQLTSFQQWVTIEELAITTTELCKVRSRAALAEIEVSKMLEQLATYKDQVEANASVVSNLESIREKQDKRIEELELTILQSKTSHTECDLNDAIGQPDKKKTKLALGFNESAVFPRDGVQKKHGMALDNFMTTVKTTREAYSMSPGMGGPNKLSSRKLWDRRLI